MEDIRTSAKLAEVPMCAASERKKTPSNSLLKKDKKKSSDVAFFSKVNVLVCQTFSSSRENQIHLRCVGYPSTHTRPLFFLSWWIRTLFWWSVGVFIAHLHLIKGGGHELSGAFFCGPKKRLRLCLREICFAHCRLPSSIVSNAAEIIKRMIKKIKGVNPFHDSILVLHRLIDLTTIKPRTGCFEGMSEGFNMQEPCWESAVLKSG